MVHESRSDHISGCPLLFTQHGTLPPLASKQAAASEPRRPCSIASMAPAQPGASYMHMALAWPLHSQAHRTCIWHWHGPCTARRIGLPQEWHQGGCQLIGIGFTLRRRRMRRSGDAPLAWEWVWGKAT